MTKKKTKALDEIGRDDLVYVLAEDVLRDCGAVGDTEETALNSYHDMHGLKGGDTVVVLRRIGVKTLTGFKLEFQDAA